MARKTGVLCLLVLCFSMLFNMERVQARVINGQELVDAADSAIRQYAGSEADVSIALLGAARDIEVQGGEVEVLASLPSGVRYNMPTLVNVNVLVDGRITARNALRFEVKLYQNVVVATRNLALHDIIQPADLRYERLDTGHLSQGFLTSIDKAVGLQVVNFVRPGTVLTSFSLKKPVVIKRNSTVNIIARSGILEVSTVGIAMQDGIMGQIIRVQNANSRKFLSVKVLDEANVLATSSIGR